jgi:hypothetical protein
MLIDNPTSDPNFWWGLLLGGAIVIFARAAWNRLLFELFGPGAV